MKFLLACVVLGVASQGLVAQALQLAQLSTLDPVWPGRSLVRHVDAFDFENDGDSDLVMTNGWNLRLLRNDGRGQFANVTAAMVQQNGSSHEELRHFDVDRDGFQDIIVGRGDSAPFSIYRSVGGTRFVDIMTNQFPPIYGGGQRLEVVDIDGDGDVDVLSSATASGS